MTAASVSWAKEPARPPVACVGETMAALVPDRVAPLEDAARLGVRIAGAESNVAVYLADHGVPARWVSALGDDPFGRRIRGEVAAAGVDVTGVRTDPHRPTGLLVKDPGTGSTRVHYYRRGSAASALTADVLDEDAVRTAGLVHLSGITPALSPDCHDLVAALLGVPAAQRPRPVSFDVNHRPALWPDDSAPGVLLGFARQADITFVGLDEAQALWGAGLTDAAAVRALLPQPRVLVVKDGGRAATAFDGDRAHTVPAAQGRGRRTGGRGRRLRRRVPRGAAARRGHRTGAAARAPHRRRRAAGHRRPRAAAGPGPAGRAAGRGRRRGPRVK